MTDIEIYNFLCDLEPESIEQANKIKKMMCILFSENANDSAERYLKENWTKNTIIGERPSEIYEEYLEWSKRDDSKPVGKRTFSNIIRMTFNVRATTKWICDNYISVYQEVDN